MKRKIIQMRNEIFNEKNIEDFSIDKHNMLARKIHVLESMYAYIDMHGEKGLRELLEEIMESAE